MDIPDCDLQNYQLARQLHMMSNLYEVFLTNAMCYPLFYDSLHPDAKRQARTVLLALHRVFERGSRGDTLFTRSPYRLYTMRCILSYLVYADCPLTWPSRVPRQVQSLTTTPPVELPATPLQLATVPSSLDATPLRLDGGAESVGAVHTPGGPDDHAGAPARSPQQQPTPPLTRAVPPPAAASAPLPVSDIMARPLFFIRPLNESVTDRSTPHFGTTTQIYVRMIHPHLLNEESLNPYFGRYGQVDCAAIQRTPLEHYAVHLGEAATEALHQLFASSMTADSSSLYVQDFIISVDSHQNAVHAVRRAYYKELACIALHDPAGTRNTHCLADVNLWMRRHAFVWRLRAEVPTTRSAEKDAGATTEAAAAAKRRKRMRAKHRLQERRRKRRAVLGEGGDSDAASSARASDAEGDSSSSSNSGSSSSGSSRGSSESSSHDDSNSSSSSLSVEDDLARFVPDVLLDGFPYWTTEDQLKVLLQEYGTVAELRLSLDDLSGAFTGCVLVRMSSLEEAMRVSRVLHGSVHRGHRLVSGVINERLEVVALEDGEEVRVAAIPDQVPYDVSLNERVWV